MGRALGSNVLSALAFELIYGRAAASGYTRVPLVSSTLGDEQGLVEDDAIGLGREPGDDGDDVVNNTGDVVIPVDVRVFGLWLKSMLGAPQTTQGVAASGVVTFTAQPANNATVTLNGQAITFVTGTPGANQVKIGATLADTVAAVVEHLNRSAVTDVAAARYAADLDGTKILVKHKTIGTAGNSFTLAAGTSPASNATVSGATLAGGSTTGPYNHVFTSGAMTLPSWSLELGSPEVPSYPINLGGVSNTLTLPLARSGNFNATLAAICQGEDKPAVSSAGTPAELAYERFSHFTGQVESFGVPLSEVTSGSVVISNGLSPVEVIRSDGKIGGVDLGKFSVAVELAMLFANTKMQDRAAAGEDQDLVVGWSKGAAASLTIRVPRFKLPRKAKRSITGPGGISATYAGRAKKDPLLNRSVIITLVNDVASYA